jgi:hypothetical protein
VDPVGGAAYAAVAGSNAMCVSSTRRPPCSACSASMRRDRSTAARSRKHSRSPAAERLT